MRNSEPKDLRDGHERRSMSEVRRGTGIRRFKGGWRYNRVQGEGTGTMWYRGPGRKYNEEPGLRYSEVQ